MLCESKDKCCGCTACFSACPTQCISMIEDEEGFSYPKIDEEKCIHCNKCEKVCPILNPIEKVNSNVEALVGRIKDKDVLKDSTSGGIPTALFDYLSNQRYYICGATYDHEWRVVHQITNNKNEYDRFRGSKYVQSDLNQCFSKINELLKQNEKCVFIGVPCQVEGLKKYLAKDYGENLITIDLVCHGAPSPYIWKKHVEELKEQYNDEPVDIKFRNKTYGYHSSTMLVRFKKGRKYIASGRLDSMLKCFFGEIISRPSCYNCHFKSIQHSSDLTLFDCKRYTSLTQKKDDDAGYTAILVQSELGSTILNRLQDKIETEKVDLDQLVQGDGVMILKSATPHPKRADFIKRVKESNDLKNTVKKVFNIGAKDVILEKSKLFLYKTGLLGVVRNLKKK